MNPHNATSRSGSGRPHYREFTITFRHNTHKLGKNPLDERSARRRDLYLTTRSTHKRQTSLTTEGLEPTILAKVRPQTYALDRAASGIGH
jgi:hypothetical protein